MYCRICGCKVKADARSCPNCGAQASADFCGGFWNLVEEAEKRNPKSAAGGSDDELSVDEKEKDGKTESGGEKKPAEEDTTRTAGSGSRDKVDKAGFDSVKKMSKETLLFLGIAVVWFVLAVVQSVRLASVQGKYNASQENVTKLGTENGDLDTRNKKLDLDNQKLQSENRDLQQKLEDLKPEETEPENTEQEPAVYDPGQGAQQQGDQVVDPAAVDPTAVDPETANLAAVDPATVNPTTVDPATADQGNGR